MQVLSINNLTKKYGDITAVNNLSMSVEAGNVYGLLGPNGSGKTTTLGIVLGITHADKGSYEWFEGTKGNNARRNLGALLETPNFYPFLDAIENLKIVAHIKRADHSEFEALLDLVDLSERKHSKFRTYSLGMKQRLAIAAAMVGSPDVLIFDEPTNGLDPQGIAEVRNTIKKIAQSGKTIIMASHILDEVEKVCTHVAIIKKGHLLATGPVGAILSDDKMIEIGSQNMEQLENMLRSFSDVRKIEKEKEHFLLYVHPNLTTADLNETAFKNGITISHLVSKQRSLEAEFLEITKNK